MFLAEWKKMVYNEYNKCQVQGTWYVASQQGIKHLISV